MASDTVDSAADALALAETLWFLPRPARPTIANKLIGLGVRRHPELATLKVETPGPKQFANITPQYVTTIDKDKAAAAVRAMATGGGTALTAAQPGRSQRVAEVLALADVLWFLPMQARRPIATKLHGLGVRLDPELAAPDAPKLASSTSRHADAIGKEKGLAFLRGAAAQTGATHLAELADRIEAADTPEKIAAVGARLKPIIPGSIKAVAEHLDAADDLDDLDDPEPESSEGDAE